MCADYGVFNYTMAVDNHIIADGGVAYDIIGSNLDPITEYYLAFENIVDVYRYEIRFATPQNNLYFNAINLETVLSLMEM